MPEDSASLALRRRVYEAIVAVPGVGAREVQRTTGATWGETTENLLRLEEGGHVQRERGAGQDFFFARAIPPGTRRVIDLGRSEVARRLVVAVLEHPGSTPAEIAATLGVAQGIVSIRVPALVDQGILNRSDSTASGGLEVADRKILAPFFVGARLGRTDRFLDRTVDSWAEIYGG